MLISNYFIAKWYYYKYYKINKIIKLRNKLRQIKNINCIINILKVKNKYISTDELINKIYTCYLYEPPSNNELQTISIIQQQFYNKNNIEEFSITLLWTTLIYYIDNLPKLKRQKTWP